MKVGIIGAGLSGLVSIKELVEAGHRVQCFEKNHDIGGVFSDNGSYDSVKLTVSNYFMAFSDMMPVEDSVRFWTRAEYKAYLDRYAERFALRRHIEFGCNVECVRRSGDGWEVTVAGRDGKRVTHAFDRVAICAGQFQHPNIPAIDGLDTFPGPVIHSTEYRNAQDLSELHGKRVLCFGMGESAADVVAEVAEVAGSSVLSLRRYHMFSARCAGGLPIDVLQCRYWHGLPARRKADAIRRQWVGLAGRSEDPAVRLLADHIQRAGDEPGSVVTKTERIFHAQAHHGLEIDVGGVARIEGTRVHFTSGRSQEFDAIVFCTGFSFTLPYLEEADRFTDIRDCYLQMFHPRIGERLAFVGFVRPQQGGIPLMAELQARYLALLWAGRRQLPANAAASAARDGARWRSEFYETPNVFGLVNGLRYNEQLASLIGCQPPEPSPVKEPAAYFRYWFHHVWPCQYRLVGPGARAEARRIWAQAPSIHDRSTQLRLLASMARDRARSLLPLGERERWRAVQ